MPTATQPRPDVFSEYATKAWPHLYHARIRFRDLTMGGTPTDPKVAEGWLRKHFEDDKEALARLVAETMAERTVNYDEALSIVTDLKMLKGFKRDPHLFFDGRVVKANLKEAVAVAANAGKIKMTGWGAYKASHAKNFAAEHIQVVQNKVYLEVDGKRLTEHHGIQQRFVHTFRGSSITYEEYVNQAELAFDVVTDWDYQPEFWGVVWNTAYEQGLGASRSMGFGRFNMIEWTHARGASRLKRAAQAEAEAAAAAEAKATASRRA
jgi:hypothetical protein